MLLGTMVVLALATRTAVSLKLSSNDIPGTGITENDTGVCFLMSLFTKEIGFFYRFYDLYFVHFLV